MHAKLYTIFLLLLTVFLWSPESKAQSPQPFDCNTCNYNLLGAGSATLNLSSVCGPPVMLTYAPTQRRVRFQGLILGNIYRASVCANPLPDDTYMTIATAVGAPVAIPGACDDDGCGVTDGLSAVVFRATVASIWVYLHVGGSPTGLAPFPIGPNFSANVEVVLTCLGPPPLPPNDEPCNAVDLSPLSGSCSTPVAGTTIGSTETTVSSLATPGLTPTGGCGTGVNFTGVGGDVWYRLTVPGTGLIGIQTTQTSICAGALGIYRATSCAQDPYEWVTGTTTGLCSIDGLFGPQQAPGLVFDAFAIVPPMVAGDVVYIRYWERRRNEEGQFTICAYAPQRPVNNAPCGAIALTPADPCTPAVYSTENSSPDLTGITVPALSSACGNPGAGLPVNDLWFVVTVPATNNFTVTTTAGSLDDMAMAWYRLSAGNLCAPPPATATLVQIACNDNVSAGNLMPRINSSTTTIIPALAAGEQIYVRVWNREPMQSNYWGTFSICVTPNTPPVNNLPCGAIALDVNYDCVLTPATTENATLTPLGFPPVGSTLGTSSCAGSGVQRDVWFTVQVPLDLPPGENLVFDTEGYTASLNTRMTVYRPTGDCGSTLALTQVAPNGSSCNAGGSSFTVNMPRVTLTTPSQITPGEILYIRITSGTVVQGNFGICVSRSDPQSCGGIVYDNGGPTGNYAPGTTFQETYCPTKPGDVVTLTFLQFSTEQNVDLFRIYNGETAGAPLLGVWSGNTGPGTISATVNAGNPRGCLTVVFTSDFSVQRPGFAFKLSCSEFEPQPAPVGDCGLQVFDPGGVGGQYANGIGSFGNPPFQATYCAPVGEQVTLNFSSFDIEANWDKLWIFDGPNTASPIISSGNGVGFGPNMFGPGAFWGTGAIGPFTSTGNCLTIYFQTDASVTLSGWAAQVVCGPPGPVITPVIGGGPTVTTACGSLFVDDGNNGAYANFGNYTRTICPPVAGEVVQITFLSMDIESSGPTSCWDALYVYDGPSVASPLISSGFTSTIWPPLPNPYGPGGYCGTTIPGPFVSTHPSGCITFRFFSDNTITNPGWRARIDCFPLPTNDNPCPAVNATPLPVSVACVPVSSSNQGGTNTAGVPPPGCGNYAGGDVWFRFTAPPSGRVFIETFAGTLTDGAMALYSAAACPGPFSLVQCNDDGGVGAMPRIDRLCNPLIPGQQYWVRFWGNSGGQGTFSLCVRTRDDGTPISDCIGAFTLCSDEPFSGSNLGAGCSTDLAAVNWGCLSGGERQGNWYAFSVQNPGTLGITLIPSGNMDLDWAVWGPTTPATLPNSVAGSCIPTLPPIRCSNASLYNTLQATPGLARTGMGNTNLTLNSPQFSSPLSVLYDGPLLPTDGWVPGLNVSVGEVYLLFVDDHHLNGGTYTVTWDVTPTVLGTDVMNCDILPVELLTFDAKARTEHVDVFWSTATERNSSHFMVQRSADAENFLDIGRVAAAGQSVSGIDYGFVDVAPLEGISYYRLKQVDQDGSIAYSNMVPVAYGPGQRGIELYPNPAVERVWVMFDMPSEGPVSWQITDASGRSADQGSFSSAKGRNGQTIELNKLETGTYLLQLYDAQNGPIGQARFVKQH